MVCYNCGKEYDEVTEGDYYLVVKDENDNQWLYEDVYDQIKETDELYEFEICPSCCASQ